MRRLDFWFEFASTYSYPAAMALETRARARHVAVRWRPFVVGPIFADNGWTTSPFNLYPAKGRYMWRDLERICAAEGLPFRRPDPFPQNSLLAARVAMALEGAARADFSRAVFGAEFGEGRPISAHETLGNILGELGLDAARLFEEAASPAVKEALRGNVETARSVGLFGSPSFVTAGGEIFWGYDRMDQAIAWAAGEDEAGERRA